MIKFVDGYITPLLSVADLGGARRTSPRDQIFLDFMQFSGKFDKIVSQRPLNPSLVSVCSSGPKINRLEGFQWVWNIFEPLEQFTFISVCPNYIMDLKNPRTDVQCHFLRASLQIQIRQILKSMFPCKGSGGGGGRDQGVGGRGDGGKVVWVMGSGE